MGYDINDAWQQRQVQIEKEREQLKLEQQLKFRKLMKSILVGIAAFFTLTFLFFSCERIDAGHVGVKVNQYGDNKGVDDVVAVTGMVFYNPFTTAIYEFPTYIQHKEYKGENSFVVNSKDGSEFSVSPIMNYSVQREKVPSIFSKYRRPLEDIEEGFLKTAVYDAFRLATNKYTADELISNRAVFEVEVRRLLDGQLLKEGFIINQFTSNLIYPETFNTIAKKFTADANKNLKQGQLPVRALEFSFDEPSKVIKNKSALENYGELFDDIYKKHGYSFKVPSDVKTANEVIPFLKSEKSNPKVLKALAQKSPRIFGIPAAAYLGYQALSPSTAEAKVPSPIQDTQTAMQDQAVEGQEPEMKLAEQIKYDSYAGFVKQDDPNVKASQSDVLYWIADNEIPEEVQQVGKMVGEVGAVLGGATVALGLPDVKKTIEERRAIGKSPITGTLAKGFYRLGSPLATAAFTVPQVLDEEISGTDIATDPLNYLGLATMETLGKRAGTIAAPAAARAPGILGFAKDFGSLKNVGEAIPGKLSTALRLGLSPRVIAGASRFLGIPGLIASTGYSLYDYLSNKESE